MKAYVFPGQGAQFPGMAKDLYDSNARARQMLEQANGILGFRITDVMFSGSDEDLRQTRVTQPAVFLHSVVAALCAMAEGVASDEGALEVLPAPEMVAGHSLGEFSALVVAGALSFEDGLRLVAARAAAMQKCCEAVPGAMAAVTMLPAEKVEQICAQINAGAGLGVLVPANYNNDAQIVISGTAEAVAAACPRMKEAGARRALPLSVSGAFHSPLMEPARAELAAAIEAVGFRTPVCPVYQNVSAEPSVDPATIKANLLRQLTSPVRWTQSVKRMIDDGADSFTEFGPGSVLQGLCRKIASAHCPDREIAVQGL